MLSNLYEYTFVSLGACEDTLPCDYKCNWGCNRWADKNNCNGRWNELYGGICVASTSGLVRDYCRLSCDNCGNFKRM